MDQNQERAFSKLAGNLEDLVKLYRSLLELVRNEKEILISADREKLEESTQAKEQILMKLKIVDTLRAKHASEMALMIGANAEAPRLLEIAQKVGGNYGDKLRGLHAALEVLVKRITGINKENESYAQSALQTLNGAMNNIKDTLSGKKTYEKKGQLKQGPHQAGNFVSKEA